MSMFKCAVAAFGTLAGLALTEAGQPDGIGTPLSEAEIAAFDISIPPDGRGLPQGVGSVAEGARIYADMCAACHGEAGEDGPAGALVGGVGSLTSPQPVKTVGSYWPHATTLFDYIRRAMPYSAPGSLADDEVYAVTAFLLHRNGILPPGATLDAQGLRAVEMPNRHGFESHWPQSD